MYSGRKLNGVRRTESMLNTQLRGLELTRS